MGYALGPNPLWLLINSEGKFEAGTTMKAYYSNNKSVLQPVYQDIEGTVPWPTDDDGGIAFDDYSSQGPFYWIEDSPYYLVFDFADGRQETFDNYLPSSTSSSKSIDTLQNYFLNSDFRYNFYPEGNALSITSTVLYTIADGPWMFQVNNNSATNTVEFIEFANGQDDVSNDPNYYLQFTCSSIGSSEIQKDLIYRFKGVNTFSSETISISLQGISTTNSIIDIRYLQYFGSGDEASESISGSLATQQLTDSWDQYAQNGVDIPDIQGKTVSDTDDDYLDIIIRMPLNQICIVGLTQLQIERSSVTSSYDYETDQVNIFRTRGAQLPRIVPGIDVGQTDYLVPSTTASVNPNDSTYEFSGGSFPVGGGLLWISPTVPAGFLLCNGGSYDIATVSGTPEYGRLYNVIGQRFGIGSSGFYLNLTEGGQYIDGNEGWYPSLVGGIAPNNFQIKSFWEVSVIEDYYSNRGWVPSIAEDGINLILTNWVVGDFKGKVNSEDYWSDDYGHAIKITETQGTDSTPGYITIFFNKGGDGIATANGHKPGNGPNERYNRPYYYIQLSNCTDEYYIIFFVDGDGEDPVLNNRFVIKVNITSDMTAEEVCQAVYNQIYQISYQNNSVLKLQNWTDSASLNPPDHEDQSHITIQTFDDEDRPYMIITFNTVNLIFDQQTSSNPGTDYFINISNEYVDYYQWFAVDNYGENPLEPNRQGIMVSIDSSMSPDEVTQQVADTIQEYFDAGTYPGFTTQNALYPSIVYYQGTQQRPVWQPSLVVGDDTSVKITNWDYDAFEHNEDVNNYTSISISVDYPTGSTRGSMTITFPAASLIPASSDPDDKIYLSNSHVDYYMFFFVDGVGTDPGDATRTPILVNLVGTMTAAQVATQVYSVLDRLAYDNTNAVQLSSFIAGNVTNEPEVQDLVHITLQADYTYESPYYVFKFPDAQLIPYPTTAPSDNCLLFSTVNSDFPDNSTNYYAWFSMDGLGTDPLEPGRTGIKIDTTSSMTASEVTQAFFEKISSLNSSSDSDYLRLTNLKNGLFLSDASDNLLTTIYVEQEDGTTNTKGYIDIVFPTSDEIDYPPSVGSLNYLSLSNTNNNYYMWFKIDGNGVDPAIADKLGIEVDLTSGMTNEEVTEAVYDVIYDEFIDVGTGPWFYATSTVETSTAPDTTNAPGVTAEVIENIGYDIWDLEVISGTPDTLKFINRTVGSFLSSPDNNDINDVTFSSVNEGDGSYIPASFIAEFPVSNDLPTGGSIVDVLYISTTSTNYYMWFKIDGVGTDPVIAGRTPIEIDLDAGMSADDVVTSIYDQLYLAPYQVVKLTFAAGSSFTGGDYFDISGQEVVRVWYSVDGEGDAPEPAQNLLVKVEITAADTDITVRSKTMAAMQYIQYQVPNPQGYFIRIWDNGAGVDPDAASRVSSNGLLPNGDYIGTTQDSQNLSHMHSWTPFYDTPILLSASGSTNVIREENPKTKDTDYSGGAESRGKNMAFPMIIKY